MWLAGKKIKTQRACADKKKRKRNKRQGKKEKKSDKTTEHVCPATINKSFTAPAEPFLCFSFKLFPQLT
jgi:hypothetical protein